MCDHKWHVTANKLIPFGEFSGFRRKNARSGIDRAQNLVGFSEASVSQARVWPALGIDYQDLRAKLAQPAINGSARLKKPFDRVDGFIEHGLFIFRHLDVDDFFNAACANDCRHANVHSLQPKRAIHICR